MTAMRVETWRTTLEIMGDEDIGELEPLLQIGEEIDDLRLDRDVERRDRLVGDDQLGLERDGARDADALALAAGEFVREALACVGRKPTTWSSSFATRSADLGLSQACRWTRKGSAMMSRTRRRGLSEA